MGITTCSGKFIGKIFIIAILGNFFAKSIVAKELDPKQESLFEACVFSKLGEAQTDSAFTFIKDVCRTKHPRLYLKDWEPSLVPKSVNGTGVETDKYKLFFPVENAWSEDGDLFLAGTFPNYKYSYVVYIFGSGESFERLGANPKNSVCDKFRVKKLPKWLHWNSYYKNTPELIEDPFYMFDRFSSDVETVGVLKFNGGRQYINRAKPGIKPSKWTQDSIDRGETIEIDFDYCFALYTVIESIKKPDP